MRHNMYADRRENERDVENGTYAEEREWERVGERENEIYTQRDRERERERERDRERER